MGSALWEERRLPKGSAVLLSLIHSKVLDHVPKSIYMPLKLIIKLTIHLKYYFTGFLVKYGHGVMSGGEIQHHFSR